MTVLIKAKWRVNAVSDHVYHTDQDCEYVERGKDDVFDEIDIEDVPDDSRECKACAGTADTERGPRDSLAVDIQDEDIGPADLGLTPLGER